MNAAFEMSREKYDGVAHNVRLVDSCLFIEAEGLFFFEDIPFRRERA